VVRAHDTPNFIANRIGIAGMLMTMKQVENFGLGYDVVDDLTGKKLGRASSGTFRTADVVGLDTMAHVIKTLQDNLSPETDPFYEHFATPKVLARLMEMGHLGQKTGAGFYKKAGRDILRFDLNAADGGEYVPSGAKADEVVGRMLKKPLGERLALLRGAKGAEPRFLWAMIRDQLHYCAVHLAEVAETARDIDLAMRWGFGMAQGPFEMWQQAGWATVAKMIQDDIDAGASLCSTPLPAWVFEGPVFDAGGVHTAAGSWNAKTQSFVAVRSLPVYQRQHFPERVMQPQAAAAKAAGTTLHDDEAIRLWTLDGEVLIASIQTKMHAISAGVAEGLALAVEMAEKDYKSLVVWSPDEMFSAGADLQEMLPAFMAVGVSAINDAEEHLQQTMLRMRYANVPTVSAVRGLALGGGCELAVYSAKRVAAMESYIGLVEVGVGLVPGAGGLAYIARRAAENAQQSANKDVLPFLTEGFTAAAMAKVGTGAIDSRRLGYLLPSDVIVPHKDELLYVAIAQAKAMTESGYRPPLKRPFAVAGRNGIATIKGSLVNMLGGGFISQHDFLIASKIAHVVCGGDVDAGTLVTEEYLMALEREAFCSLLVHPKTQARIMGMLSTGKPVRN
jgi:3-hydroxyacyl-CoA dehydrogenase